MTEELPFCVCGCGERVSKVGNRYINHHGRKGKKHSPESRLNISKGRKNPKSKLEPKLCECGCGEYAKPGDRFIWGHNGCKMPWKPKSPSRLCKCGCGQLTNSGCEFILGHNGRVKKYSSKERKEMSDRAKNSDPTKVNIENMRGGKDTIEHHYIYDHANPELYTIKISRKKHPQLHMLLRNAGIVIPHINKHIPWRYYENKD